MRKLLVIVLFINNTLVAAGQNLKIEGTAPDFYIIHKVAPKENFYSVGRLYNQAPKSIAAINNITMEKGLTIGQDIKIPLAVENIDRTGNAKNATPLSHTVAESETLFKIARDNDITAQQMRKWNSLTSDHITAGTSLIIGYLKTNGLGQAPITSANNTANASANGGTAVTNPEHPDTAVKQEKENTSAASDNTSASVKMEKESKPEQNTPNESKSEKMPSDPAAKDTALAVIPEKTMQPAETAKVVKEASEKQKEVVSEKTDAGKTDKEAVSMKASDATPEGVFANVFDANATQKSLSTKSGDAATFKSVSGWQDKKYYVLMSNVTPGTILKISASNNKVVYAKVLGSMPEMKENNQLLLRISNAAASYLGIIDPRFHVEVSYYQ